MSCLELVVLQDGWLIYLHFQFMLSSVFSREFCFAHGCGDLPDSRVSRCRWCIYHEQQRVVKDIRFRKLWLPLDHRVLSWTPLHMSLELECLNLGLVRKQNDSSNTAHPYTEAQPPTYRPQTLQETHWTALPHASVPILARKGLATTYSRAQKRH